MLPTIRGKVAWVFDTPHFDADLIIGLDNFTETDPDKLKACCMRDFDPNFAATVEQGDIVICAENFGYGHPHKGGPDSLLLNGISAIFAESFSPGFYRTHSQRGTPLFECDNLLAEVQKGDRVEFDWDSCELHLPDRGRTLQCKPMPVKSRELVELGGLMEYIRQVRMKERQTG